MAKFSIIFLVFVAFILMEATLAQEECPKNQQFTTCGSACPPRCNDSPTKICTLQCIIGCQCKPEYVLNDNGECVTPAEC